MKHSQYFCDKSSLAKERHRLGWLCGSDPRAGCQGRMRGAGHGPTTTSFLSQQMLREEQGALV